MQWRPASRRRHWFPLASAETVIDGLFLAHIVSLPLSLPLFAIFSSPSCLRLHFGGSEQRPRLHLKTSVTRVMARGIAVTLSWHPGIRRYKYARPDSFNAARCLSIVDATRSDNIPEGICLLKLTLQATVPPTPPLHSLSFFAPARRRRDGVFFRKNHSLSCC